MERLMRKGYLAFDNVEVAFDPEFRTAGGQDTPGVPTGSVTAGGLNAAQARLNTYCRKLRLLHRKLLLVHEWIPDMIRHRARLRTSFRYVQPVVVMDGIGAPAGKTSEYARLLGRRAGPFLPGIKLFPPNLYDAAAPTDTPLLTWRQIFGCSPISAPDGTTYLLRPVPRVIVFT
jgi:hypothetical protein